MPAQEETYRKQNVLHIVFALSSIAMMVSILWMIAEDHFREWKVIQRDFIKLDAAKTKMEMEEAKQLASADEMAQLTTELEAAREAAYPEIKEAEASVPDLLGKVQKAEQALAFKKADRDSIASFYDIALEKGDEPAAERIKSQLGEIDAELITLRQTFEQAADDLKKVEDRIADVNKDKKVTEKEKEIAAKQKEIDRLQQKQWTIWSAMRSAPVLDSFTPAVKIEQLVLSDLTIHYSFKGVPRFDRCTTCHKAIDSVTKDGEPAFTDEIIKKVAESSGWDSPHKNAFRTHPHPEIFTGPNSPHPREKFGCTVCHEGQGSGTTFTFASHSPDSIEREHEWKEHYGWEEIHHWPYKMLRSRFAATGCVKCHPHVVDLEPAAEKSKPVAKLLKGYNIVRTYGCFGCHEINGWKNGRLIGPDLRIEPQTDEERIKAAKDLMNPPGRMRKVGPSLRHIADKVPQDWTHKWIKLPQGFRPETRMPQFFGLTNNSGETKFDAEVIKDEDVAAAELHAVVHYLYSISEPAKLIELPDGVSIDPKNAEQTKRGREGFIERGCLACHSHKETSGEKFAGATAEFGPDLSNVAAKLVDKDGKPNVKWLFNWLKDPLAYHATSFMPNLQLTNEEAADIAAWLLSVDGGWSKDPGQAKLDEKVVDAILRMFLSKSMTLAETDEAISKGVPSAKAKEMRGDEKLLEAPVSPDKKLTYIGKKTISRMGCFGCHDIPGFDTAKPIGTELTQWGLKARMDPDKLDFAHIVEYLDHHGSEKDKESPDFALFMQGMKHHKGESFLWQKLRDPRSYDFNKLKAWDDKLRMPRFPFADDPEAVEAVMTFILGLVGDDAIPPYLRNVPQSGPKIAKIEGAAALAKFNCQGCHMLRTPTFTFDTAKMEIDEPNHRADFPEVVEFQKALTPSPPKKGSVVTVSAMLAGADVESDRPGQIPADATELYLDIWEPASIAGKDFFVGDRLTMPIDAYKKNLSRGPVGGPFAELLVAHLVEKGDKFESAWAKVPPPLVREGMKAQPMWVHQFLLDPSEIRPGVVLRMPRFNLTSKEAESLAAYFAAVDGEEYPYEQMAEREAAYLDDMESKHAGYLKDGFNLMTLTPDAKAGSQDKLCVNCHNVGTKKAEGTPAERGPNLWLTPDRLRPTWLKQWIASPKRLLPYTGMPNNFTFGQEKYQEAFKGTSSEQVTAVRDALINYNKIQNELANPQVAQQPSGGK
jgi:mono/diheme cytochrome c family protein